MPVGFGSFKQARFPAVSEEESVKTIKNRRKLKQLVLGIWSLVICGFIVPLLARG